MGAKGQKSPGKLSNSRGVIHRSHATCQDLIRRSRPSVQAEDDITGGNGRLLDELTTIVSAAAAAIVAECARSLDARIKPDRTPVTAADEVARSEEHTSELQSLRHLVCRLLLEKK